MSVKEILEITCDRCRKYEQSSMFDNLNSRWNKVHIDCSGMENKHKRMDLCADCFAMFEMTCKDFMEEWRDEE